MIPTRLMAQLVAASLFTAGALAQPAGSETTTKEPPAQAAAPDSANSVKPDDTPAQAPVGADRSPSDYRASEKISEDLPVSFPVDI
jgi:hypothetical protein